MYRRVGYMIKFLQFFFCLNKLAPIVVIRALYIGVDEDVGLYFTIIFLWVIY